MNGRIFAITAINGFLAMAVGMTLILYALREGNVGMVALLSSTTPIMLLPILWIYTKQRHKKARVMLGLSFSCLSLLNQYLASHLCWNL